MRVKQLFLFSFPRKRAMLGQPGYSRTMLPNVREIERRLRSLEQQLERVGDPTSASRAALRGVKNVGHSAAAVEKAEKISLGSSPPHLDPAITGVPTSFLTLYRPPPIATY